VSSRSDGMMARLEQLNRRRERAHDRDRDNARAAGGRKPVRRAVSMSAADHGDLNWWCAAAAAELGMARVSGQEVLRALVVRLLTDPTLVRQIRSDLDTELRQRRGSGGTRAMDRLS
jgi:hypothetical protein